MSDGQSHRNEDGASHENEATARREWVTPVVSRVDIIDSTRKVFLTTETIIFSTSVGPS